MASIVEALETESRASLLRALCLRLAAEIDAGVSPRDLAALTLRLTDISREYDEAVIHEGAQRKSSPHHPRASAFELTMI